MAPTAGIQQVAKRRNNPKSSSDNPLKLREMRVGIKKEPATLEAERVLVLADLTPAFLVGERLIGPVCGPTEQIS